MNDRCDAPPFTPDPPGHWQDVVQADDSVVSTFFANDPEQGPHYDRTSYISDLIGTLKDVRRQLANNDPVARNSLIILIESYTADRPFTSEELDRVARTILIGTRQINGGAIETLRKLLGA